MIIKQQRPFTEGYNSITEQRGKHAEMLMDYTQAAYGQTGGKSG